MCAFFWSRIKGVFSKMLSLFVEDAVLNGVKKLLGGRVNEIAADYEFAVPPVEFDGFSGGAFVLPVLDLGGCERSEKERLIRLDVYSLTINAVMPERYDGELCCYAWAAAVEKALGEDSTLGGAVSRAVMTGKTYVRPKSPYCGAGWEVKLSLRVIVEGGGYAG
jgi:hypothetical protein